MSGKFEGEPDYVEHFWNLALSGFSDEEEYTENDVLISKFRVTEDTVKDCANFEDFDLEIDQVLKLWEDDNGFVYSRVSGSNVCMRKG